MIRNIINSTFQENSWATETQNDSRVSAYYVLNQWNLTATAVFIYSFKLMHIPVTREDFSSCELVQCCRGYRQIVLFPFFLHGSSGQFRSEVLS
jgi:hypothetical protein